MRCISRWAFSLGSCALLVALSGWSAFLLGSPLDAPKPPAPTPDTLISPLKQEPAARSCVDEDVNASSESGMRNAEYGMGRDVTTRDVTTRHPDFAVAEAARLQRRRDTRLANQLNSGESSYETPDTLISPLVSEPASPELPALEPQRPGADAELTTGKPPANLAAAPGNLNARNVCNEQELREILEIRREQGDLFHGTLFEDLSAPTGEGAFLEALRSAATSQEDAVAPASLTTSACEATYARQLQQEQLVPVSNDLELVQTLRQASRQLDNKAADLEESQQYPEAARMRGLARRLRKQARSLDASALPPLQQADSSPTPR